MTSYQKFVRDMIVANADEIENIGRETEFSDFFQGEQTTTIDTIIQSLERCIASMRHPDFSKSQAELDAEREKAVETEIRHSIQ